MRQRSTVWKDDGAAELKKDSKSADEAGKILVDEFKAKYPGGAQPARVAAGVATVYRELP